MARNVTYKAGQPIIKAGSKEKVMYVILKGEVSVRLIQGSVSVEVAPMTDALILTGGALLAAFGLLY